MKPKPPHSARRGAGKPDSHHHLQVRLFLVGRMLRSGHVYWRYDRGTHDVLVVENQIRPPNVSGRNSDLFNAAVVVWVPVQVDVFPLL